MDVKETSRGRVRVRVMLSFHEAHAVRQIEPIGMTHRRLKEIADEPNHWFLKEIDLTQPHERKPQIIQPTTSWLAAVPVKLTYTPHLNHS